MRYQRATIFVAALYAAVSLATALLADEPASTPAEQALAELKQIGGVLVHYDDRQPERPVIAVDFANHPGFQEAWLKYLAAFPRLSTLGLSGIPLTDEGLRHVRALA